MELPMSISTSRLTEEKALGLPTVRSLSPPLELKLATREEPARIPRDLRTYGPKKGSLPLVLPKRTRDWLEHVLPQLLNVELEDPEEETLFKVDLEGPEALRVFDADKKKIPLDVENLRNAEVAVFAQIHGVVLTDEGEARWRPLLKLRQILVVRAGDGCAF